MTHARAAVVSALLLAASAWSAPALAVEDSAELVRQGVALRREHKNEEARALFARAVAITPKPSIRAQLALAEEAVGQWLEAERDLDAALAAEDDPWITKNRDALAESRDIVRKHLGWLQVDVDAQGAAIRVDGRALSAATQTRLVAGEARLEVEADGYVPDVRRVVVRPAERLRLVIHMVPLPTVKPDDAPASPSPIASPASAPEPAPAPAPPRKADRRIPTGAIVLGAAGIAALGTGIYFGVVTLQAQSDRKDQCPDNNCTQAGRDAEDRMRSSATASTIAFAGGVVLLGGAVTWWLLSSPRAPIGATLGGPAGPLGATLVGRF